MTTPDDDSPAEKLFANLRGLKLDDDEKKLLSAVLKVARDVTYGDRPADPATEEQPPIADQFKTAFTADNVDLIMSYADAELIRPDRADSGSPGAKPAMIVRYAPVSSVDDDD